jgi:hypothetical protein
LETYLEELSEIRAADAGVKKTTHYGPLPNLLDELARPLKPKVKSIIFLDD